MKPLPDTANDFLVDSCSAPVGEENYRAFLLRLWRSETSQPWRAALIPAGDQEQIVRFVSVGQLAAFLQSVE